MLILPAIVAFGFRRPSRRGVSRNEALYKKQGNSCTSPLPQGRE